MYIISKHKDYYDGVAGTTGIDKTIVYEREIIEIENKDFPKIFRKSPFNNSRSPFLKLSNTKIKKQSQILYGNISPFIIGFCGKLYVGWKLYSEGDMLPYGSGELITTITYDNENIKTLVEQYNWDGNFNDNLNYVLKYDSIDLFREFIAPIFVYDGDYNRIDFRSHKTQKFFINPLLKEYQFFKVFDSYQTFQEIQMFLSGVLGGKEKEIVTVADKYKIAQHGFDKWSFRKEPQK